MTKLAQLLEIAKRELKEEIKSGKRKLHESYNQDQYDSIADEYLTPEIEAILKKWDNLGFDSEGQAVNAILTNKNWKDDSNLENENPSDIQKVQTWRQSITKKKSLGEATGAVALPGDPKTGKADDPDALTNAEKAGNKVTIYDKNNPAPTLEAKKDKEGEEAPVEEEQPVEQPADDQGSLSAKLGEHISAAIDAAADCIQNTDDKKYETTLGKVVKNLTAAQAALEVVAAHETKLAEEAGVLRDKSLKKYVDAFKKQLKKVIKDDALIEKIIKIYKKVIETSHDKEVPAEKMTEQVWKHFTLNESIQRKAGVMLNELSNATTRDAIKGAEDKHNASVSRDDKMKSFKQKKTFTNYLFKDFEKKTIKGVPIYDIKIQSGVLDIVLQDSNKKFYFIYYDNKNDGVSGWDNDSKNRPVTSFGFSQEDAELLTDIIKKFDPSTKVTPATFGKRV